MKVDLKRKQMIKEINTQSSECVSYPNQCAYTDSIIDKIIEIANKLPNTYECITK